MTDLHAVTTEDPAPQRQRDWGSVVSVLSLVAGLLLWEAAVRWFALPSYLLPAPSEISQVMVEKAVAQMLARAGLQMQVQAEPLSVFYPRLTRQDFALVLNGWGSDTGDSIVVLRQALHSVVPAKGLGGFNRGRYTNPEADKLIEAAASTLQSDQREAMQAKAMHLMMEDNGVIPLYTSAWVWGSRSSIVYQAGFEEGRLAARAHPAAH